MLDARTFFGVVTLPYGFSWDGAELTDFDFGKISQLTHRPDKTLMRWPLLVEVGDCDSLLDLDLGRFPYDIRDARVGQQA